MREIKFRGRRLDNGEWVYGFLFMQDGKAYIITDLNPCGFIKHEVDPATVGQFTGQYDKEGRDIYEGDSIRCFCPENLFIDYMGIVKFKDCSFNFYHIDGDGMLRMRDFNWFAIEIMGNIHDNPELLKGGAQ